MEANPVTHCCTNCGSTAALGTEAANVCFDCAAITAGGATVSLPWLIVLVAASAIALSFVTRTKPRIKTRCFGRLATCR
ncbi:MAG: hypothetical protein ACYTGR_16150 [Planctomycetota bacterium]|jgi:hypothetical protein